MIASILTSLGTLFIDSCLLRTITIARAYYVWCNNYKSSYISKSTFDKLNIPEYGSEEAASHNERIIKGNEYHVMIRTTEATYLIRIGQSYHDAMKVAEQITRGFWFQACSSGEMSYIDLRDESNPNLIPTLLPEETTNELLSLLEEL